MSLGPYSDRGPPAAAEYGSRESRMASSERASAADSFPGLRFNRDALENGMRGRKTKELNSGKQQLMD